MVLNVLIGAFMLLIIFNIYQTIKSINKDNKKHSS